jgi:hypothetical protein
MKQRSRCAMPMELSKSFALAVTEETCQDHGWIAKNGEYSLFRTLQRMLPQVRLQRLIDVLIWTL